MPIIIAGAHRSGTTLFRRILNSHSRIFCPPEVKFYKDLLGQFPSDPLAHGRLGSSIACLELPVETWLDQLGRGFIRCMEIAMVNNGKKRWADKNPENAINIQHWHRLLSGNFHFILIVRHPFDIVASMDKVKMPRVLPTSMEGRAEHINEYIDSGLQYCSAFPDRSTVVFYENLVSRPQETLDHVLTSIGEQFESHMIENPGAEIHGSGLEDPKARGRENVSAANIGRWKRDLSPDDIRILEARLGGLLERLGYK